MFGKPLLCAAVISSAASISHGSWYAGDPSAVTVAPLAAYAWSTNVPFPGYAAYTFDNFNWTNANGGVVSSLGGHFISLAGTAITGITYAQWEIRSGVSAGNGGTLVASGSGVPSSITTSFTSQYIGYSTQDPVARVELDVPDFVLAPGTYWLGFSIGDAGIGNTGYVAETTGTNGIGSPLDDGNAFYFQGDGTTNPWNYVGVTFWGGNLDAAYFVNSVPTPGAASLLGVAALMSTRRRR